MIFRCKVCEAEFRNDKDRIMHQHNCSRNEWGNWRYKNYFLLQEREERQELRKSMSGYDYYMLTGGSLNQYPTPRNGSTKDVRGKRISSRFK